MDTIKEILWLPDKIKVVMDTDPHKIDTATQVVLDALDGKLGFCYKNVRPQFTYHPTLSTWRIELHDIVYKLNTMPNLSKNEIYQLRWERDVLKAHIAKFTVFDTTAYKQLKSGYGKLNRALQLLYREGEVRAYTVTPRGRLEVKWFDTYSREVVDIIEQGFTYAINRTEPLYTKGNSSKYHIPDFSTYNSENYMDYGTRIFVDDSIYSITVKDILSRNKELVEAGEFPPRFKGSEKVKGLLPGTTVAQKHKSSTGAGNIDPKGTQYKSGIVYDASTLTAQDIMAEVLRTIRAIAFMLYWKERYERYN